MEILDQSYLNELVVRAGRGDSNAFAELFAATWETQFFYLCRMQQNRKDAVRALQEVYTQALQRLPSLGRAGLFLPWLSHISYLYCREQQDSAPGAEGLPEKDRHHTREAEQNPYHLSQILNLPLTESQILLMTYVQGLSDDETGRILNLSNTLLRRYRKEAVRHLRRGMQRGAEPGTEQKKTAAPAGRRQKKASVNTVTRHIKERPGAAEVTEILENVFEACGQEPNTVPMEALASYAVYRRERFSLQKGVLIAGLILFLLLPLLFLLPDFEVQGIDEGERGLPVYTIEVYSLLPVGKVNVRLNTHALPVYEAAAREYTVEPTRNGTMHVYVELVNRQSLQKNVTVRNVDASGPELNGSEIGEETLLLRVSDAGIGVDYREIVAVGASGTVYHPLETDEAKGEVLFVYPEEDWDVYIPDHIGNTLHLALTLE